MQGQFSQDELLKRVTRYEEVCNDLSILTACVAYWAKPTHKAILQKILARSTDRLEAKQGQAMWINLRWYPLIIGLYCAGIAAVEGKRYDSLSNIFYAIIGYSEYHNRDEFFVEGVANGISDLNSANVFKQFPGHEQQYVPMSEYLFKVLQPKLDDVLFIGKNYERSFDEFEVLFALAVADLRKQRNANVWGPIGRFGWKHSTHDDGPLKRIILEAGEMGERWEPIQAGLFGGRQDR